MKGCPPPEVVVSGIFPQSVEMRRWHRLCSQMDNEGHCPLTLLPPGRFLEWLFGDLDALDILRSAIEAIHEVELKAGPEVAEQGVGIS